MSIVTIARPEIRALVPYSSARMEASGGQIQLNANESPWPPIAGSGLNRYPDPQPSILLDALAQLYDVAPANILVGRGSDEAIDLLVRAFCHAGKDSVLVCPPTFGMYAVCARVQNAGVVEVPLTQTFEIDEDELLAATTPDCKIIFLCTPNNPTGGATNIDAIARIANALSNRALVVRGRGLYRILRWRECNDIAVTMFECGRVAHAVESIRAGRKPHRDRHRESRRHRIIAADTSTVSTADAVCRYCLVSAIDDVARANRRLRIAAAARTRTGRSFGRTFAASFSRLCVRGQFPLRSIHGWRGDVSISFVGRYRRAQRRRISESAELFEDQHRHARRKHETAARARRVRACGVSARKLLFVDRDGTLIVEPPDEQVDRFEKLALVDGVIPALRRCVDAGYELVMITNQDGLGTASFARDSFDGPQRLLLQILGSQGIRFREILIDDSFPHEQRDTRKPGVGLVRHYLADDGWSRRDSAVIGDRDSDEAFAANIGVRSFRVGAKTSWSDIAHSLCDAPRIAHVERKTNETTIDVEIDLDRTAAANVATGIGFFDHMLEQVGKHGGFSLSVACRGDTHVDEHHVVEDCALAIGEAVRRALGDKRGIARYGADIECESPARTVEIVLPMDETLARASLDLSGRAHFVFDGSFSRDRVGELPTELIPHFFRSLSDGLRANLHLAVRGDNTHHMVEACFKSVARALRQAIRREGNDVPSTKGVL